MGEENNAHNTILVAPIGKVQEFCHETNDWPIFKARLENYFIANEVVEEARKRATLLNLLSENCYRLTYNLSLPKKPEELTFTEVIKLLDKYFAPAKSILACRYTFYEAVKDENESVNEWSARIRNLAADCEFNTHLEVIMRDKFITGFEKGKILDRLLEEKVDVTMDRVVEIALAKSAANEFHRASPSIKTEPIGMVQRKNLASSSKPACNHCGNVNHTSEECFKNKKCFACGGVGHWAKFCRNKNKSYKNFEKKVMKSDRGKIFNMSPEDCAGSDNCIYGIVEREGLEPIRCNVMIANKNLEFQIDTGASISAISEEFYTNHLSHIRVGQCNLVLVAYNQTNIDTRGLINVKIKYNDKVKFLKLYIIKNGGPPILGRDFISKFNLEVRPFCVEVPSNIKA